MTTIATARPRRPASPLAVAARFAPLIFLLALMALFATLAPRFLLPFNLFNIMRQVSIYGIVAVGMTFVVLARGIDLSVGSLIALAGLVAAVVAKGGLPDRVALPFGVGGFAWPLAALAAMLVGVFAGLIQGIAIAWLRVPAFVVTLGGLSVFRGLALMIGDGGPVSGFSEAFGSFGQGMIGPVPVPVILFLAIALLGYLTPLAARLAISVPVPAIEPAPMIRGHQGADCSGSSPSPWAIRLASFWLRRTTAVVTLTLRSSRITQ